MKTFILLLLTLGLLTSTVQATDYFVSTNGLNTNNGLTLTSAWRNISKALKTGGMPNGTAARPTRSIR